MKRKWITISVLLSLAIGLRAQTANERSCFDYDFSPEAAGIIKSGSSQPDLNTGTLNLSVPIYTWKDIDFNVPLVLSYSTNGFKPAKPSGITGVDWTLVVGGRITRQINGIDDLKSRGRSTCNTTFPNDAVYDLSASVYYDATNLKTEYLRLGSTNYETDPDLFKFDFFDYNGSFVLNSLGDFVVFDSNGNRGTYDIEYDNTLESFKITTADGFQYYFGTDKRSREVLHNTNPIYTTFVNGNRSELVDSKNFVICWCLDKVVAPNGRELHFAYSTNTGVKYNIPNDSECASTTFSQGKNLLTYITSYGELEYHELPKHASITSVSYLDSMYVKESLTSPYNTIARFNYSFKEREVDSGDDVVYSQLVTRQKRLDSINISTIGGDLIGGAKFNYIYQNTRQLLGSVDIVNVGKYQMEYNLGGIMPGILTNALDFWGYYNGRTDLSDNDFIPTMLSPDNYYESIVSNIKNPNPHYSKIGTLSKIIYPTGGYTVFEYEHNTADLILLRQPSVSGDSENAFLPSLYDYRSYIGTDVCGGLRIKSISDYDGNDLKFKRSYTYTKKNSDTSSGIVTNFRKYHAIKTGDFTLQNCFITFPDNTLDKSHMAYSTVTEHYPDGSSIIYQFTDYIDCPDEFSPYNKQEITFDLEYTPSEAIYMNNVMREPDSRHYRRGKVKSVEKYDAEGNLLYKKEYEYEDSDDSYASYLTMSGVYMWSARRFTCDRLLTKETETLYNDGQITTVKSYDYNQLGQLRSETYSDAAVDNGKKLYFRYWHESPSSSGTTELKGAISDRVTTRIIDGAEYIVNNEMMTYDPTTNNINPLSITKYCIDNPILCPEDITLNNLFATGRDSEQRTYTYLYNTKHRLIKEITPGEGYVSYQWNPQNKYVISKTVNHPLQTYHYEWKDMVGLTKLIQPTLQKETYEYDDKNRLKTIYDTFDNPVVRYEYNVINE